LDLDVFHGRVIEPLKLHEELLFLQLYLVFSGLAIMRELHLKCHQVVIPRAQMILLLTDLICKVQGLLDPPLIECA
jgi:hypothetical protein